MEVESLIALPASVEPLSRVRSTLLQSSLNSLRERGHFDRYVSVLPPERREVILGSLAPEWLPLEVAMAHYEACDTLG